jgi:hypothetical protein
VWGLWLYEPKVHNHEFLGIFRIFGPTEVLSSGGIKREGTILKQLSM